MALSSKPQTPRAILDKATTEREFMESVIEMAQALGWMIHHSRPARTKRGWRTAIQGSEGFPDLVLGKGGMLLFWECKRVGGRLAAMQKRWLEVLKPVGFWVKGNCRIEARVITPADWDYICEALQG